MEYSLELICLNANLPTEIIRIHFFFQVFVPKSEPFWHPPIVYDFLCKRKQTMLVNYHE